MESLTKRSERQVVDFRRRVEVERRQLRPPGLSAARKAGETFRRWLTDTAFRLAYAAMR